MKNLITLKDFFEDPRVSHVISKDEIENIHNKNKTDKTREKDPLYIRILTSIGAWFAAIFILMFLGIARIIEHGSGAVIVGIIFFSGAILFSRVKNTTFLSQLSLALALAGNCLVLFGVSQVFKSHSLYIFVIIQAVICCVIYPLFSNNIYRFLVPIALVIFITAWIIETKSYYSMNILIAVEMILFGSMVLQNKRHISLNPLLYSAATMLPANLLFMNLTQINIWGVKFQVPLWPSSILLSIGLIYLFIQLAGRKNCFNKSWFIIAVCSILLLGIITTPGILVAIGLLVIGYAYGDDLISGIAYIFIPCFIGLFYYALNIDLAYKSWILAGSGLILITVRLIVNHLQTGEETV